MDQFSSQRIIPKRARFALWFGGVIMAFIVAGAFMDHGVNWLSLAAVLMAVSMVILMMLMNTALEFVGIVTGRTYSLWTSRNVFTGKHQLKEFVESPSQYVLWNIEASAIIKKAIFTHTYDAQHPIFVRRLRILFLILNLAFFPCLIIIWSSIIQGWKK